MAATSAVILYYLAGLHAGVAVELYKTYKQFEIPTLVFKTSSCPGEICQFRQKGKARLKCSDHVCVPCSAREDFLLPGMLLCFPQQITSTSCLGTVCFTRMTANTIFHLCP